MSKREKILRKLLRGSSDHSIRFDELCDVLTSLGFESRTRGSHHIFFRSDVEEILNLQPLGSQAKPYQVKQVRGIILRYRLAKADED